MSNARIDRMVRELSSEPSSQFFLSFFGLIGLGKDSGARAAQAREAQSLSTLKTAPALIQARR